MSIALLTIQTKHERRLRLFFTNTLAAGAFTNTSLYTITNQDGKGANPLPAALFMVAGAPNAVEIQLDTDLVQGAYYNVTAIGVPCTDTSVTPNGTNDSFMFAAPFSLNNREPQLDDAELRLFGRDLVHNGVDYVLTSTGDIATIGGVVNAVAALERRLIGSPLPWNPSYSPNSREYVDGAQGTATTLRGRLIRQGKRDDRVQSITATFDETTNTFTIKPVMLGGRVPEPITIDVQH